MRRNLMFIGLAALMTAALACTCTPNLTVWEDVANFLGDEEIESLELPQEGEQESETQPEGEPTSAPTEAAEVAATSTPEPGSSACQASGSDPAGDTTSIGFGDPIEAPGADILEVSTYCQEGLLIVEVVIGSAGVVAEDHYSSATRITVYADDETKLYELLHQVHAGELTTAVTDSGGSELDWRGEITISAPNDETSVVRFEIPVEQLPQSGPIGIGAQAFSQQDSEGTTGTDETNQILWTRNGPPGGS